LTQISWWLAPSRFKKAPRSAVQDGTPLAFSQVFQMKQAALFLVEAKGVLSAHWQRFRERRSCFYFTDSRFDGEPHFSS